MKNKKDLRFRIKVFFMMFLSFFLSEYLSSTLIPLENIKILQSATDLRLILQQLELFVISMQMALEKNRELWSRMSHELCTVEEFYSEYQKIENCSETFRKLLDKVTALREQAQSNSSRLAGINLIFSKMIEEEKRRTEVLTTICDLF